MRSTEGTDLFDFDASWQSQTEWGDLTFQNLTADQLQRMTGALKRIAAEGKLETTAQQAWEIAQHNMIQAIRIYYKDNGVGLLEAKEAIEDYVASLKD